MKALSNENGLRHFHLLCTTTGRSLAVRMKMVSPFSSYILVAFRLHVRFLSLQGLITFPPLLANMIPEEYPAAAFSPDLSSGQP
jgi:hypothetical protein